MKTKLLSLLALCLFSGIASAQNGRIRNPLATPLLCHPGFAGSADQQHIALACHTQWAKSLKDITCPGRRRSQAIFSLKSNLTSTLL